MRRLMALLLAGVALTGFLALYRGGTAVLAEASLPYRPHLLVLAAGFALLSFWSQRMPSGATIEPGMAFSIAGMFLLPPVLAMLVPVVGLVIFRRGGRWRWWMYPVCIGQSAIALFLGGFAYRLLNPGAELALPGMLPGALAALVIHAVVQTSLSGVLVAFRKQRPSIRQVLRGMGADANWGSLGLYLMGVTTALTYHHFGYWSLLLEGLLVVCMFQAVAYYAQAGIWQRAAWTDGLTGAQNRAAWEAFLRQNSRPENSQRQMRRATLIVLDMDGLKYVNDHHGHSAGDRILRELVRALLKRLRSEDRLFRIGGDEFVIYVAHGQESDEFVKERINRTLEQIIRSWAERGFRVAASAGMVSMPAEAADLRVAFRLADARMYVQKERHHQVLGLTR